MTRHTFQSAARLSLALLAMAGAATATAMIREELDTLSQRSDAIVRGRVTQVKSRWTADHLKIVTDVDIEVTESFKGATSAVVRVMQPGGEVEGIGQRVSGLAAFSSGEEVIVFLRQRPGALYQVEGAAQGKFRVERSSDGKSAFAIPEPTGDAMLLDAVTRQPVAASTRIRELTELRREVRQALGQDPAGKEQP